MNKRIESFLKASKWLRENRENLTAEVIVVDFKRGRVKQRWDATKVKQKRKRKAA